PRVCLFVCASLSCVARCCFVASLLFVSVFRLLFLFLVFFFFCCGDLRGLHSFPTRRSSDLESGRDPGASRFHPGDPPVRLATRRDRKSTRLNSSHGSNSYAVFCLKKKKKNKHQKTRKRQSKQQKPIRDVHS